MHVSIPLRPSDWIKPIAGCALPIALAVFIVSGCADNAATPPAAQPSPASTGLTGPQRPDQRAEPPALIGNPASTVAEPTEVEIDDVSTFLPSSPPDSYDVATLVVSPDEFVLDWQQAPSVVHQKYAGKLVELSGNVVGAERLRGGSEALVIGTSSSACVLCVMTEPGKWLQASLGTLVTIRGQCANHTPVPTLRHCRIEKVAGTPHPHYALDRLMADFQANIEAFKEQYRYRSLVIEGVVAGDPGEAWSSRVDLKIQHSGKLPLRVQFEDIGGHSYKDGDRITAIATVSTLSDDDSLQLDASVLAVEADQPTPPTSPNVGSSVDVGAIDAEPIETTAFDFQEEWENDESPEARSKYFGKRVQLVGRIDDILSTSHGDVIIGLEGNGRFVACTLRHDSKWMPAAAGQFVSIVGRFAIRRGPAMYYEKPGLVDCEILSLNGMSAPRYRAEDLNALSEQGAVGANGWAIVTGRIASVEQNSPYRFIELESRGKRVIFSYWQEDLRGLWWKVGQTISICGVYSRDEPAGDLYWGGRHGPTLVRE